MSDASTAPVRRVFNAINGAELLKIILKEFQEQGELHDEFNESITFPIVEWEGELRMRAYPRTPSEFTVKLGGEIVHFEKTDDGEKPAFKQAELERPIEVELKIENIVDNENPADKVREDNGLPVSMPEPVGPRKTVVDKPRIRPRAGHHAVEPEE